MHVYFVPKMLRRRVTTEPENEVSYMISVPSHSDEYFGYMLQQ